MVAQKDTLPLQNDLLERPASPKHLITRVRHETRRRTLTVETVERQTPRMLRITFISPELHDFVSASADDHIKLFFAAENAAGEEGRPSMRDFTPRQFDTRQGRLVIDFALHQAGPATQWASAAKLGDTLEIGGPRGSAVIPDDFDWYLLIGDETALPAMGRRVAELRAAVPVVTIAVVAGVDEIQNFETRAQWSPRWAIRDGVADDATLLRTVLADYSLPSGDGFVWIAAEAGVARAVRSYIVHERGHPREWIKAAGYWTKGQANAHERIED